jgi:hypothetical protein
MPSKINLYQIGVWFCVGFFIGGGWAIAALLVNFIRRLNGSEVRGTAAGTPYRRQRASIAVGVLRLGFLGQLKRFRVMLQAIGRMSAGWPSSLWVERLRTSRVRAFWRRSSSCLLTKRPAAIPCGCCPVR